MCGCAGPDTYLRISREGYEVVWTRDYASVMPCALAESANQRLLLITSNFPQTLGLRWRMVRVEFLCVIRLTEMGCLWMLRMFGLMQVRYVDVASTLFMFALLVGSCRVALIQFLIYLQAR